MEPLQGFALELLFTLMFVLFFLSVSDPVKRSPPCVRVLGVGVALTGCHVCLVSFTGCGMNRARSVGPVIMTGGWTHHWVYWLGPLSGGVVASVFYNFVFFVNEGEVRAVMVREFEGSGKTKRRRSKRWDTNV